MKKVVAVVETLTVARAKCSGRGDGLVVCMKETMSMASEVECGAFHIRSPCRGGKLGCLVKRSAKLRYLSLAQRWRLTSWSS